jgi:predicted AAA+ superfamily ATPase
MFDRTISKIVEKTSKGFPVVLLTGMRQIGKSWIVEYLAGKDRKYITLDDMGIREFAKRDPKGFIAEYIPPIVIDEVQYAPELFPCIKMYVDKHKQDGLYWLTGSQQYNLMDKVKESLAGRVGILDMLGLSYKEIIGKAFYSKPFLPTNYNKPLDMEDENRALNLSKLYKIIWHGSFPKPLDNPETNREKFYSSYLRTYIERDVKDSLGIKNDLAFYDFIRSVAHQGLAICLC